MPIKLKKTNIQYDIDSPDHGYMILGFDEVGNLVTKSDTGEYKPVVNEITTGVFVRLEVDYLTVGNRVSNVAEGIYSIAQGLNIAASGDTSFAQGNNVTASGLYSFARGEFVDASNTLSYASGRGASSVAKLVSSGINSFVHSYSTGGGAGVLGDYSAILGGRNNNIGTSATDSAIVGGTQNTINASVTNSVILGGSNQTATNSNATYLPRIVLTNHTTLAEAGALYFDGSNFYGHDGTNAKLLSMNITSPADYRVLTSNAGGTGINAQTNLTFDGSLLTVQGDVTVAHDITAGDTISSTYLEVDVDSEKFLHMTATSGDGIESSGSWYHRLPTGNDMFVIQSQHNTDSLPGWWGGDGALVVLNRRDDAQYSAVFVNKPEDASHSARGIRIQSGVDTPNSTNNYFIDVYDTDGDEVGVAMYSDSSISWYYTSDERVKADIADAEFSGTDIISSIPVRTFKRKAKDGRLSEQIPAGFIAQELMEVVPDAVCEGREYLMISDVKLIPYLVKAIQELKEEIDSLKGA